MEDPEDFEGVIFRDLGVHLVQVAKGLAILDEACSIACLRSQLGQDHLQLISFDAGPRIGRLTVRRHGVATTAFKKCPSGELGREVGFANELSCDAAESPDIDGLVVVVGSKDHFRGSIPSVGDMRRKTALLGFIKF